MFEFFESKERQSEKWYEKGISAFRGRNIDTAIRCLLKAIELNPFHAGALHDMGVIAGQFLKDWATAKRYMEQALRIEPNFPSAWRDLAIIEKTMGNTSRAVELFKMTIEKYGWNPRTDPSIKADETKWLVEHGIA